MRSSDLKGLLVDKKSRQRIISCTDIATLDLWLDLESRKSVRVIRR
jgi:hypothetical protein